MPREPKSTSPPVSHGKTVAAAGVGGAIAVVVVIFLPEMWPTLDLSAEKASILTVSFSTIFSYLARFLPKPRNGG